jgi:hypothetical protein
MHMTDLITIVIIVVIAIAVIILLIWKNNKDKKLINPDAQDSVEETIMDQKRREDKI